MLLLGEKIKSLRKEKKLTQEQLGELINVTKVSICCYEKGRRNPTLDTLIDLANALSVDLKVLMGSEYFVKDNEEKYGINLSKQEMELIVELRKHINVYEKLINDPDRTIKLIDKKIR